MIHDFPFTIDDQQQCAVADWSSLARTDIERVATLLLGASPSGSRIRRGDQFVVIANQKLGSIASKLDVELSALASEAKKVLTAGGPDAKLRVAAAYHLRFENIHPLGEGNGRVGRAILAAQIYHAYKVPPHEFLLALRAQEMDYLAIFASSSPPTMYELLLDLLAQLTGQIVSPESAKLPFSILPLHPDRRPLIRKPSGPMRVTR